jgi:hypothetical protein
MAAPPTRHELLHPEREGCRISILMYSPTEGAAITDLLRVAKAFENLHKNVL